MCIHVYSENAKKCIEKHKQGLNCYASYYYGYSVQYADHVDIWVSTIYVAFFYAYISHNICGFAYFFAVLLFATSVGLGLAKY